MSKHVIPDATPGTTKSGNLLAANVSDLLSDRDEIHRPIWIRCPARGTEHFTGLRRGYLYALAAQGKIRSVSIRAPGKIRGTRLFHLASILAFIATSEAEACGSPATADALETTHPCIVPVSSEAAARVCKKAPHGAAKSPTPKSEVQP